MGVYDCIHFNCPNCGRRCTAQSKSGACVLVDYDYRSVPAGVAIDANRHAPFNCECGSSWHFGNIPVCDDTRVTLTLEKG